MTLVNIGIYRDSVTSRANESELRLRVSDSDGRDLLANDVLPVRLVQEPLSSASEPERRFLPALIQTPK